MAEFVSLEVLDEHPGVGVIRLSRPPMNALNRQMQGELAHVAAHAAERGDIKSVIIYGGEKVFAAGADIKEMEQMSFAQMSEQVAALQAGLSAVAAIPKPTVAAITGYALGGGLEVALSADFRVAGDNVRVGLPETTLGVIPGGGGTQRLARLIGSSKAKDLIFTGRYVKADEALALGIVDRVVAPDDVFNAAMEWAGKFTASASRAIAAAKAAIDSGLDVDLATGLKIEQTLFASTFATEDKAIGMRSFIEDGPGKAVFVGR